jgi:hypothetical protein
MKYAIIPLVLSITGCATVFTGTHDQISISSEPSGAKVVLNGNEMGRTPVTIPVSRTLGTTTMTLKKQGFEDKSFALQSGFNTIALLDIFLWPTFIVDAATGSIVKYTQTNYNIELDKRD